MSILDLPTNKLELFKRLNEILRNASDQDVKAIKSALEFYAVKPIDQINKPIEPTTDEVKASECLDADYVEIQKANQANQTKQADDEQDERDEVPMYCDWCDVKVEIDEWYGEHLFYKLAEKYDLCKYCNTHVVNGDKCRSCREIFAKVPEKEVGVQSDEQAKGSSKQSKTTKAENKQNKLNECYYCGSLEEMPGDVCPNCSYLRSCDDDLGEKIDYEADNDTFHKQQAEAALAHERKEVEQVEPTKENKLTDHAQSLDQLIDEAFEIASCNIEKKIRQALVEQVNSNEGHPFRFTINFDKSWPIGVMQKIIARTFLTSKFHARVDCDGYENTKFTINITPSD